MNTMEILMRQVKVASTHSQRITATVNTTLLDRILAEHVLTASGEVVDLDADRVSWRVCQNASGFEVIIDIDHSKAPSQAPGD